MGVLASKEPDADRARQIAEEGCVLRTLVGSSVHGLGNPATDDRDEMGVCIEPEEYVLGLREFEHFVSRTQAEGDARQPHRRGEPTHAEVKAMLDQAEGSLQRALASTLLPERADGDAINAFLVDAYERAWAMSA